MDIIQGAAALAIFENPTVALFGAGADLLLPVWADLVPTFMLRVYLAEHEVI